MLGRVDNSLALGSTLRGVWKQTRARERESKESKLPDILNWENVRNSSHSLYPLDRIEEKKNKVAIEGEGGQSN